jgi:hypothetical protein
MGRKKKSPIVRRAASEVPNFIDYNNLDQKDRLAFAHCGFDRLISIASRLLRKRIGEVETVKLSVPYFTEPTLVQINALIDDLLWLIGTYSNSRFGQNPALQNSYFRRPSERTTFSAHLYISRFEATKTTLKKNEKYKSIIEANSISAPAYSKHLFKGIIAAERMKFGDSEMTKTETRAVGVLYMLNLVRDSLKGVSENGLTGTIELVGSIHSLLDESDTLLSYSEGSLKADKSKFEEALEIIRAECNRAGNKDHSSIARKCQKIINENLIQEECPKLPWITAKVKVFRKKTF